MIRKQLVSFKFLSVYTLQSRSRSHQLNKSLAHLHCVGMSSTGIGQLLVALTPWAHTSPVTPMTSQGKTTLHNT